MSNLELRIPPIVLTLICLIGMWATAVLCPALTLPFHWSNLLAVVFVCCGALLPILAAVEFRRAKTTLDPRCPEQTSQLVTRGVFGLSRNPIYLGFVLLLIGAAWYLMNMLAVFWVLAFGLYMTRFQIQPEERHMEERFSDEFRSYSARVKRWF